nr:ATP synthase CF0 B chain [Sciadococcus taiwanensis]
MKLMFSEFNFLLLTESDFGLNFNLLESNLINIMILVSGLFYLGKKFIVATLSERQNKVLEAIQEAEERLAQAQERLSEARKQLEQTQLIINNIKQEAEEAAQKVKESVLNQGKEEITRLTYNSKRTISNTEVQIRKQIQEKIISSALKRVFSQFNSQLNSEMQARIIDYNIARLGGQL